MNYHEKVFWWSISRDIAAISLFAFLMFYTEFWTWESTNPELGLATKNPIARIPYILISAALVFSVIFLPFQYVQPNPKGMNEPDKIDTKCYCGCHQMKKVVCGMCYRNNYCTLSSKNEVKR